MHQQQQFLEYGDVIEAAQGTQSTASARAHRGARLRQQILADAVRLGQRLIYRGVGTIEYIVSGDTYYFLGVNPRLQVEHSVTEMVTGIDIVELVPRLAAGEGLPFS